jgi:rhodanese-related sulfurtransferase
MHWPERSGDCPSGHWSEDGAAATLLVMNPFETKLQFETDPADVWAAIRAGGADFTLVDARSADSYARAHLPGAVSIHGELPDGPLVTYCWSPGCNAATKAAARLHAAGREVKEMIGGFEYWVREGLPIEGAVGGDRLVGP